MKTENPSTQKAIALKLRISCKQAKNILYIVSKLTHKDLKCKNMFYNLYDFDKTNH